MIKRFIDPYINALVTRKLCLAGIIVVLAVALMNCFFAETGKNNKWDSVIEPGDICRLSGRVTFMQMKTAYGSDSLVTDIKDAYLLSGNGQIVCRVTGPFAKLQVYFPTEAPLKIGQRVVFEGKVCEFAGATNDGQFDAYRYYTGRGYLFRVKYTSVLAMSEDCNIPAQFMYTLRLGCDRLLDEIYGEEDGAILKAMLIGIKGQIDEDIQESFQKSGAAHILAISGLHISFLCMTLIRLLGLMGVGIKPRTVISATFLLLYITMVGFSPSACRAAIMFLMYLMAGVFKRSYDMMTALSGVEDLLDSEEDGEQNTDDDGKTATFPFFRGTQ